jgi:hypothetical protein
VQNQPLGQIARRDNSKLSQDYDIRTITQKQVKNKPVCEFAAYFEPK